MDRVRFLQIEPTTRCNFTCGFCCGRVMPQADLDRGLFTKALAALPELAHIELQGEGESLLHPGFLEMVAAARQRGSKVSFITNGSLLSQEVAAKLVTLGIEKVSISIESADPQTFARIRGGKLDKVVRGIRTLLAERHKLGVDRPVVGFSITILGSTKGELPGILALYRQLGLDGGVTLQPLSQMAPYVASYPEQMLSEQLSRDEIDDIWVSHRADKELARIQKDKAAVASFFDELMVDFRPGERRCPWLEDGLYISQSGQVCACCMAKDKDHALGYLNGAAESVDLQPILDRRRQLREQLHKGEVPPPCKDCELARFALMSKMDLASFALRGMWRRVTGKAARRSLPVVGG